MVVGLARAGLGFDEVRAVGADEVLLEDEFGEGVVEDDAGIEGFTVVEPGQQGLGGQQIVSAEVRVQVTWPVEGGDVLSVASGDVVRAMTVLRKSPVREAGQRVGVMLLIFFRRGQKSGL